MPYGNEQLKALRDFLAKLPDERFTIEEIWARTAVEPGYDVAISYDEFEENSCGTAACIEGWGYHFYQLYQRKYYGKRYTTTASYYDVPPADWKAITMPFAWCYDGADAIYTRAKAVEMLDRYIETGKVDWNVDTSGLGE